ncbi:MAG: hypothetical protein K0R52_124 [Alphaproteobacteria bacterium]|nr:hypothetical protein [Alphaproteobacteria bacterium]
MKSVYGEGGHPEGNLALEGIETTEDGNQGAREDFDEISDFGPIAPAPAPNAETEDEFERLVNQIVR